MQKITYFILCFIFTLQVSAQDSKIQKFQNDYTNTFSKNQESVFIHLNKTALLPEEFLWFSVYIYDLQTSLPASQNGNLELEVFDSKGNSVDLLTTFIWHGKSAGYLNLQKEQYSEGTYYLKAVTSYMSEQHRDLHDLVSFQIVSPTFQPETAKNPDFDIQLLPEGGHLLSGVTNRVGVKILNEQGFAPEAFSGILINDKEEELKKFDSNKMGMASFSINPLPGMTYKVVINFRDGHQVTQNLPEAEDSGVILSTNNHKNEYFISIKTNPSHKEKIGNDQFHLAISQNAAIKTYSFQFPANDHAALFRFASDSIFPGINTLTIFDKNFNPISERLIYNPVENENLKLSVSVKEKIGDSINLKFSANNSETYRLSVSALPAGTKSYNPEDNILSQFLLKPYLQGKIENPSYYFDHSIDARKRYYDLDLLLLTQGWSTYDWDAGNNSPVSEPERNPGFHIKGQLTNYSDKFGQLFIRDDSSGLLELTELSENGNFEFTNLFLKDSTELSFGLLNNRKGRVKKPAINYSITPKRSTTSKLQPEKFIFRNIPNDYSKPVEGFLTQTEVLDTVKISGRKASKEKELSDELVLLNTQSPLSKLIEVDDEEARTNPFVTDIIEQNHFRIKRGYNGIQIYSMTPNSFATAPGSEMLKPQIYINGARIFDENMLTTMRSADVVYIYINRSGQAGYGQGAGNGVIKIKMKDGSEQNSSRARETIRKIIVTNGFQAYKKFYAPKYKSYSADLYKDFGVIDWIPDLIIQNGEEVIHKIQNTAQDSCILFIEGFTMSGKLISRKVEIDL